MPNSIVLKSVMFRQQAIFEIPPLKYSEFGSNHRAALKLSLTKNPNKDYSKWLVNEPRSAILRCLTWKMILGYFD